METQLRRAALALGLALLVALAGCADGATGPATAPPTTDGPTASSPPAPVPLADLEESVFEIISHPQVMEYWARPIPGSEPGRFWCEGPDPVTAGAAVTCRWADDCADCAQATDVTQLVSVLDDTGRFTFTTVDSLPRAWPIHALRPEDFPTGTTSCAVLAEPQQVEGRDQRLAYPAVLRYWLSSGRPAAMDPDGDGRPCEAEYPADLVAAVFDAPLAAAAPAGGRAPTMDDVRRHAEAVRIGVVRDTLLIGCGSAEPAVSGTAMECLAVPVGVLPSAGAAMYIAVLDDDGRYVVTAPDLDQLPGPTLADYPPDSTCSDLAAAPPGTSSSHIGLAYAQVYYRWLELGQPAGWDEDGDGRPCEDSYSAAVSGYLVANSFLP